MTRLAILTFLFTGIVGITNVNGKLEIKPEVSSLTSSVNRSSTLLPISSETSHVPSTLTLPGMSFQISHPVRHVDSDVISVEIATDSGQIVRLQQGI